MIVLHLAYNKHKLHKAWNYWSRNMLNFDFLEEGLGIVPPTHFCGAVVYWLSLLHNFIQQSLNWDSGSQTCTRHVGYLRLLGSLTMVPGGNKTKRLLSVNHTTKTIHHHHQHFSTKMLLMFFSIILVNCIVWFSLLRELLGNMYTAIFCFQSYDIINFEIDFVFLIKPFF